MYYYLIGILNVFFWGIKPLIEKGCVRETNVLDCTLLRYILGGILSIMIALYLNRKAIIQFRSELYMKMIIVAIIGFLGLYLNYMLLKKYEAGYVGAIIGPLVVICTSLLGILFYGESISYNKIVGTLIISIGFFILQKNNYDCKKKFIIIIYNETSKHERT